jgi:hypothetical protein
MIHITSINSILILACSFFLFYYSHVALATISAVHICKNMVRASYLYVFSCCFVEGNICVLYVMGFMHFGGVQSPRFFKIK